MKAADAKTHWEVIYGTKKPNEVSWYQQVPSISHNLILATGVSKEAPIIDVGAGTTLLVDVLLADGFSDLTVLDISATALRGIKKRLGTRASMVSFIEADITEFKPHRKFAVWHDRAVFHFLTRPEDRCRYLATLHRSLQPQAHVIIASFGLDGPPQCSGLDVMHYSAETMAAELGEGFDLIESVEEQHTTPAGRQQQFVYCRFRAIT